jgi:hypothetical protein
VVKATLTNQSGGPVSLRRLRFDLRDGQGRQFPFLKPRKAVDELYKYYEIRTYRIAARKEIEADFEREALPTESELGPNEERHGFVFFKIPEEVDLFNALGDLTLRLERVREAQSNKDATIELRLNRQ